MYYINAISSISHQNSFANSGFSNELIPLSTLSPLQIPDYKKHIEGSALRRMSPVLRMAITCAASCFEQIASTNVDAIVVGTGFGCLSDTLKFLETSINSEGLLPPTSFIQSTHNTIAGQISLHFKNHGYNITHTQNTVSFEMALQDAMLCLDEGMNTVLVGSADEKIDFLNELAQQLNLPCSPSTSGATFMVLSKTKSANSLAVIRKCESYFEVPTEFANTELLADDEIEKVLYSTSFLGEDKQPDFAQKKSENFTQFTGFYPTNSALALHICADSISIKKHKKLLIINQLSPSNSSLILIEKAQ